MQGEPDESAEQERADPEDVLGRADESEGTEPTDFDDAGLRQSEPEPGGESQPDSGDDDEFPDWEDLPTASDTDGDDEIVGGELSEGESGGGEFGDGASESAGSDPAAPAMDADDGPSGPPDNVPLAVPPWEPPRPRHRWLARVLVPVAVLLPAFVVFTVVRQATGLDGGPTIDERLNGKLRYDGTGDPLVRTPKSDVGTVQSLRWRVCGAECDSVSGRGKQFQPGEVLAGSRVEVRITGTEGATTVVTPNWDGRLKMLERPTITGSPRIGTTVTANPGKWTGGWIGGTSRLGVRACPTKAGGSKCVAFTSSILDDEFAPSRVIPASFRGWWIGAIEWQLPPGRTRKAAAPNPNRPTQAVQAPIRSVAVAMGPLDGPIR